MSKKSIILLIAEAIILIGIFCTIKSYDNNKIDILRQNYKASQDTIEMIKLENNNLLYEKSMYILSESELQTQLNISKSEIKDLKKKLNSSIEALANVETIIKIDTIQTVTDSIIYINKDIIYDFGYKDEWLSLKGKSIISQSIGEGETELYNINIQTPLRVGITGDYKIFVESKNPYLNITDIEGAMLDNLKFIKSKPYWSHGISIGFGIHYGLFNKDIDIGPQFGYSIHYNF